MDVRDRGDSIVFVVSNTDDSEHCGHGRVEVTLQT